MALLPVAAALLSFTAAALGHVKYLDEIPNSRRVPDPCPGPEPKGVWKRLGHVVKTVANDGLPFNKNAFGEDFLKLLKEEQESKGLGKETYSIWENLCPLDSDGDGRNNGVELDDTLCIWRKGDDDTTGAVTHPGMKDEGGAVANIDVDELCGKQAQ